MNCVPSSLPALSDAEVSLPKRTLRRIDYSCLT